MRAGTWLTHRNLAAARASWRQARDVADRLPADDADSAAMRIAPRTLLCASAWLAGGSLADTGFDELRDLATAAGDKVSLAMAMGGWLPALIVHARFDEATQLASELESLLDSIGDPALIVGLLYAALPTKLERGEMTEALRLAQRTIELADGDATKGNLIIGSPLTCAIMLRGCARCFIGDPGWKTDVDTAVGMARAFEPTLRAIMLLFKYILIPIGVWSPDAAAVRRQPKCWRSQSDPATISRWPAHNTCTASRSRPRRSPSEDASPCLPRLVKPLSRSASRWGASRS